MLDSRTVGIAAIATAVVLLTVAQVTIKARLSTHGTVPFDINQLLRYIGGLLLDWKLVAAGLTLVAASFCWYAGLSRIPLSQAYGMAAGTYPLVFLASIFVLGESFSWQGFIGNLSIVTGILLIGNA